MSNTATTTAQEFQHARVLIHWPDIIEALQNPRTDIEFFDLTSITHACLARLQRNIDSEAYETITRRAARQGVSAMQVSLNA